jgi:hypothetical protein
MSGHTEGPIARNTTDLYYTTKPGGGFSWFCRIECVRIMDSNALFQIELTRLTGPLKASCNRIVAGTP